MLILGAVLGKPNAYKLDVSLLRVFSRGRPYLARFSPAVADQGTGSTRMGGRQWAHLLTVD